MIRIALKDALNPAKPILKLLNIYVCMYIKQNYGVRHVFQKSINMTTEPQPSKVSEYSRGDTEAK